jgi:hypothetical protein
MGDSLSSEALSTTIEQKRVEDSEYERKKLEEELAESRKELSFYKILYDRFKLAEIEGRRVFLDTKTGEILD